MKKPADEDLQLLKDIGNPDPEITRKMELSMLNDPPAPRLTGPITESLEVAVPKIVSDTLEEAIRKGEIPIDQELLGFLEGEVAHFNNVPRECIAAHPNLIHDGKLWEFYPQIAKISTGFTYYPPEFTAEADAIIAARGPRPQP